LEISKEDIHPSLIKGQGNSKEGYSVISAYEAFMTSTGSKRILKYIFTNPTYDQKVLIERQERIAWMKLHMRDGHKYNKYFRNIHVL
jgi:DNA mismatch repair ATPase MutS